MNTERTFGTVVDDIIGVAKNAVKGTLESNKAINPISNFTGVLEAGGRMLETGKFQESLGKTFGKAAKDETGKMVRSAANGWDAKKIAGSYLGAAAAGRVISGGGIYKDKDGNTNLIAVPFV